MNANQLTFQELAWAAFLARISGDGGAHGWMALYRDTSFRQSLVANPQGVTIADVRCKLIGFLNTWGRMMLPDNDKIASSIVNAIGQVSPLVNATNGLAIDSANLNMAFQIGNTTASFPKVATWIFDILANCGVGPTGASKVMSILNPTLFVMWDKAIANHYLDDLPASRRRNGEGYTTFLGMMQTLGLQVNQDYRQLHSSGSPESYLSENLNLEPTPPLAKFIDEFNWMHITRHVCLPPKWHPPE